jgi:tetratricopeptide (TPR) repeat protein
MQNSMEYIDRYFQATPPPEEVKEFEKRIANEPDFAKEVAFYLSAKQAAKGQLAEEKKSRFREIYFSSTPSSFMQKQKPVRKLWPYAAAAAVVTGLIICWALFIKQTSPQQLANNYIAQNFETLGVTMGNTEDEIQKGLHFYNEGKIKEALEQFEKLINLDNSNFAAKKYAGIAALRLQHFDKALHYFKLLKDQPGLYANPGTFLQATTLLKRNLPGDKQTAKALLQEVVQNDLEGRETAAQWLKKW